MQFFAFCKQTLWHITDSCCPVHECDIMSKMSAPNCSSLLPFLFSPPSSSFPFLFLLLSPTYPQDCLPSSHSVQMPGTTNSQPCINGYICDCPEGFFGANCSVDIDYCMSSPCHNNATCEDVVGGAGYVCVCVTGYTGSDCETEVDECASSPCQNGGTCTVSEPLHSFLQSFFLPSSSILLPSSILSDYKTYFTPV